MKIFAGIILIATMAAFAGAAQEPAFKSAIPVWIENRQFDQNLTAGFRATFAKPEAGPLLLRVTGSTVYRAWVNGEFCGYGPARGPHGWFRIDEWNLTDKLHPGVNVVGLEVAGYNTNTYYTLDQPSFLQAEIVAGDKIVASTGAEPGFTARILDQRVQKVERYSFQRPYSEAYRLQTDSDAWRQSADAPFPGQTLAACAPQPLLPRRVPLPDFRKMPAGRLVAEGTVKLEEKDYPSMTRANEKVKGFKEDEIEMRPSAEMKKRPNATIQPSDRPFESDAALALAANQFNIVDFGVNYTGFIGATVVCEQPTRLLMAFDEILTEQGDVNFTRLGCVNVIVYDLAAGAYQLESFEPYTCRYMKIVAAGGACKAGAIYIRRYANADVRQAAFEAPDQLLNRLYQAGVETFTQNALDLFMDCPSRERAGWLCDSFFTSRVAKDLSGAAVVEHNFFENFLLPAKFERLPAGMLPMCYPADHYNGVFIPNWAMWFVVQLEEYLERSGDRETVDRLKPKVLALIEYFKPFKNSDGLLEKLQSWVFVEWSKANDFVQDVNYPSNMLYAGMLAAAGRIYDMPELIREADAVRDVVRRQSYDGEFFVDNALRKEGKLEVTRNRSEVCQYFAFFFDTATPESYPELWNKLCTQFGPQRAETKAFPEVHPANSFVGNMLRAEILSRYGRCQQILDESIEYLLYMADRTGTLWENTTPTASCNHGFASHIVHTLYRDILGVYRLDVVNKKLWLRFTDVKMPQCRGALPTPDGLIAVEWSRDNATLTCTVSAPAGYTVETENKGPYILKLQ